MSSASAIKDEDDDGSFLSDVLVVGAGPAGLMLAYEHECDWKAGGNRLTIIVTTWCGLASKPD
jgi:ribulose 1,5-bisphosphate synthetase/thiazole synthase